MYVEALRSGCSYLFFGEVIIINKKRAVGSVALSSQGRMI